jgi:hypothetical protein
MCYMLCVPAVRHAAHLPLHVRAWLLIRVGTAPQTTKKMASSYSLVCHKGPLKGRYPQDA